MEQKKRTKQAIFFTRCWQPFLNSVKWLSVNLIPIRTFNKREFTYYKFFFITIAKISR